MTEESRWPFETQAPRAVFFDLDDTLLDTAGLIVGPALQDAAEAMIGAGLGADRAELVNHLLARARAAEDGNYFADVVERFGAGKPPAFLSSVVEAGRAAFFATDVPDIVPMSGSRGLLHRLRERGCRLFLITAGNPNTQRKKIDRLRFAEMFDAVAYVNSLEGETKLPALRDLLSRFDVDAADCLCVGDRVVGEIRDANLLGMWTVRMLGGEFAAVEPTHPDEVPDFTVASLHEFAALLGIDLEA